MNEVGLKLGVVCKLSLIMTIFTGVMSLFAFEIY